ncbi:acyltransferase family protein [Hirsutella rhossiliensis]|uniref:Acyltransferase family domain-containing protein n=1 Tax=Hirsutella rhossiliensis TaxID=111463 RepID=A0A9P8SIM3_9HYPO|nr:acyltransferase family domain-containing protein [Hirsutella rhossiliensis]KAH0963334.1 acyltransferase family domain-containing protein [Hirsutella rhossiliensis]
MILGYLGFIGPTFPTLREQLWDWYNALWTLTLSWKWDITQLMPYNPHLWTIPIEFANSLLLFVTILGLSRLRTHLRLASVLGIMIYSLKSGHWAPCEFLGGMGIAEIGMIQDDARLKGSMDIYQEGDDLEEKALPPRSRAVLGSAKRLAVFVFFVGNLVFGLFIAGWPGSQDDKTPGISTLWANTMEPFWTWGGDWLIFPWYALGAMQIVLALQQIKVLQDLFVTPPAQYLADISYALYLMHGPMLSLLEHRWLPYAWALVGGSEQAGMCGRTIAWACGIVLLGIPTIWVSDLFWRFVDVKTVQFTRWLEALCIVE